MLCVASELLSTRGRTAKRHRGFFISCPLLAHPASVSSPIFILVPKLLLGNARLRCYASLTFPSSPPVVVPRTPKRRHHAPARPAEIRPIRHRIRRSRRRRSNHWPRQAIRRQGNRPQWRRRAHRANNLNRASPRRPPATPVCWRSRLCRRDYGLRDKTQNRRCVECLAHHE
jgi:hypothetical protein